MIYTNLSLVHDDNNDDNNNEDKDYNDLINIANVSSATIFLKVTEFTTFATGK